MVQLLLSQDRTLNKNYNKKSSSNTTREVVAGFNAEAS